MFTSGNIKFDRKVMNTATHCARNIANIAFNWSTAKYLEVKLRGYEWKIKVKKKYDSVVLQNVISSNNGHHDDYDDDDDDDDDNNVMIIIHLQLFIFVSGATAQRGPGPPHGRGL